MEHVDIVQGVSRKTTDPQQRSVIISTVNKEFYFLRRSRSRFCLPYKQFLRARATVILSVCPSVQRTETAIGSHASREHYLRFLVIDAKWPAIKWRLGDKFDY